MRTGNADPNENTVICTPDMRKRALAFVGRVLHIGFIITPEIEELTNDFSIVLQWALRAYQLDVERDIAAGGWRVIRRVEP